ncbi:pyridoxamine 5'-phosphate oxidase family protein [Streptomyces sp. NBC_01808]|uniref:pyridoxamine 5'-phosphate oxidase family protein n=1 Tax=Streptomyces sp. NBC_01808 TaxID=2975947 RepID=UPI002DD99301|nr:pyridoxamine 5'-phosphate oxidase family protein [Streptomyces sp. NBC_01808]WSA36265.1 pyridoxamine 5'-phosphate oxidase family protein [Streptomyces sp. NBC_01808]
MTEQDFSSGAAAAPRRRRPSRIAMTPGERDAFLAAVRVCRVATGGPRGPHVSPLWYVWDGTALWLYSLVDSKRWRDLADDPRVAVVVDDGHDYGELRGVELRGTVERVGEVPRTGEPVPELAVPERLFGEKYSGGELRLDGRHGWLRLVPAYAAGWDFRKTAGPR